MIDARSLSGRRLEVIGRIRGRGRLLFLHGWACHAGYFARTLAALPGDIAAVAMSLGGHGASDPPDGIDDPSVWLDEIEAVIRRIGWPDVILVGNSVGGMLAIAFAATRRRLVRGLSLIGSCTGGQSRATAEVTRSVLRSLYRATRPPYNRRLVERLIRRQFLGLSDDVRDELLPGSFATHPIALEAAARFGWELDLNDTLSSMNLPIDVIRGGRDPILDPDVEPLAAFPRTRVHTFDDAGHFPMAEQPRAFARTMVDVIDRVDAEPLDPTGFPPRVG